MKIGSGQLGFTDQSGKLLELMEGEKLGGSVVRRMNNGMYLINLKGRQVTATLDTELGDSTRFRAQVVRSGSQVELKIIRNFEDGFNSALVKPAPAQSGVQTEDGADAVIFRLLKGTISGAKEGDTLNLNIVRTMADGLKLLDAGGYLFKADIGQTVLNTLKAQIIKTDPFLELMVMKTPIENLDPLAVKTEVGKFDFAALLKNTGKFSSLSLLDLTPDDIKAAIRNSGIFFENKLANGEQVSGDEKFRAYTEGDVPARETVTRLQLVNVLMADGLVSYLKTKDEDVSDALVRYKKDDKGDGIMYISLEFSKIGKTFIIARQIRDVFDILVKSEADISELLKSIDVENALIRWKKYEPKDEAVFEVKKDTAQHLGGFDATA
ncbi:hypothetical protein EP073_13240 [Geovibrio thiophilus]|uniref:Uncharacterized protein n=1 Tax=Geovibrio thiophilus TaxID=139438 RepID=A0A410K1U6_9BACT|nr:hypothetical protein [Geovibrio thiophilus]QAR34333.1 hypothetical protein EP073_13240 [Geovibrio thiophilus]